MWPFLLVLVLFPALAFGVVNSMYSWDGLGSSSDASSDAPADDLAAEGDEGAADGGEGAEGGEEAAPEDGAAEESVEPEPEAPAPVADKTTAVRVLNAAKVSGLAGKTADKLTAAGFTTVDSANYTGAATTTSGVYYASEDLAVTAAEVASTLGIPKVELSAAQSPTGITAVVAKGYTP